MPTGHFTRVTMMLSGETHSNLSIRAWTGQESISSINKNEFSNQGDSARA